MSLSSDEIQKKIIAEVSSKTYKGMGYPLFRNGFNQHEKNAVDYLAQIHEPKALLELLQNITAIASATKNVACLIVILIKRIIDTNDANIIYTATDSMLSFVGKEDIWNGERSLQAYLRALAELYHANPQSPALSSRYKTTVENLQEKFVSQPYTAELSNLILRTEAMLNGYGRRSLGFIYGNGDGECSSGTMYCLDSIC